MNLAEIFPYTPFTDSAFLGLIPFLIMGIGGTLALVTAPLKNGQFISRLIAFATFTLSIIFLFQVTGYGEAAGSVLFLGVRSALLTLVLNLVGIAALLLLMAQNKREPLLPEAHALVVYSVCGMGLLVSSNHLLFQFIAIEIMSLAIYILVALRRTHRASAEAGMKYFVLGGLASSIFLYGAALVYGATGSFTLPEIAAATDSALLTAGFVLIIVGLLFKVGAAPFHAWVPDVYEGSSLPVLGFMAVAVKFAAFMVIIAIVNSGLSGFTADIIIWIITISAILTMAWGNFAALSQKGFKRLLAYSSIAHTGYLLVGILALSRSGNPSALILYLVFYVFATIGAIACVQALAPESDDIPIASLAGRGLTHPFLGVGLSAFLLAMAGIPMTAGFIGKYLVFGSAVYAGLVPLVVFSVLASVVGIFYYLRVIVALYMNQVEDSAPTPELHWAGRALIIICLVTTLYYGIMPANIIELIGHIF